PNSFQQNQFGLAAGQAGNPVFQPPAFTPPNNNLPANTGNQYPDQPAFQHPATPPPCDGPAISPWQQKKYYEPTVTDAKSPGQNGQIIMTPARIVAPVGSEVVVLAGICGGEGYFVKNQPLEWMLSNNSVGEFVEVGGQYHKRFNQLIPPTAKKFSGQYAKGRTGLKNIVLTRGTPTPADDIDLVSGQTYISVSSASPGTSYVTAVAPNAEGWDKRRSSVTIHWVDGQWAVPAPSQATAGTVHPMTTVVSRTNGGGLKGWETRYSIVGGAPAEFAPTGSKTATATTDSEGRATVQIRQPAGQFEPGTTQVRVDIVRPPIYGESELVVESGITSVTWSAPALTIRAIGPRKSEIDEPFNYRVEVSNPGDQIARGVVVRTKNLDDGIEFISSNPKPTEYGRQYEWQIGDVAPGSPPKIINVQMKSKKQGNVGMCFEVVSATDRLQTEACAETEIITPCIAYRLQGPSTANVGDTISFDLSVENRCDEALENIEIIVSYDPGLVRPGKSNPARFENPILQVGESQPLPSQLTFFVQAPGTHCLNVEIRARGVQPQIDRRCIEVKALPAGGGTAGGSGASIGNSPLQIELRRTPDDKGLAVVEAIVSNVGDVPLEQVFLINQTPQSLSPATITFSLTDKSEMRNDQLWINLGRLNARQQVRVEVGYEVLQQDANAYSEFTVTNPTGASAIQRIAVPTNAPAGGTRPDFGNGQGNGQIGIPDTNQNAIPIDPGSLAVRVRALTPTIRVGQQVELEFTVSNTSQQSFSNVDVRVLLPNSWEFSNLVSQDTTLGFISEWQIGRVNTLRAQESITWKITLQGKIAGDATLEVQARSDETQGDAVGRDFVVITN
ncbi:MAG: hypothetical protein ACI87E_004490, partial [Mariniblastus sp.]